MMTSELNIDSLIGKFLYSKLKEESYSVYDDEGTINDYLKNNLLLIKEIYFDETNLEFDYKIKGYNFYTNEFDSNYFYKKEIIELINNKECFAEKPCNWNFFII